MAVVSRAGVRIDYADDGEGRRVVLIHSSVSGNRRWRALTEDLRDRYRVLAVNLYGYGETARWPRAERPTLGAQAELVLAACDGLAEPVQLVGHSFGGSVALRAALLLDVRCTGLVLLEPNPLQLLKQGGCADAWRETQGLRADVESAIASNDWRGAAKRFADYWLGDGAWTAMPDRRRAAFADALAPNVYEWQAVMDDRTAIAGYAAVPARTLVVSDPPPAVPSARSSSSSRRAAQPGRSAFSPRAATWRR